jgi:glycosyltransferase involved in cell wall biosynthesis
MVIYEAGALGKPVVAADVGGVGELIRAGDTGLLFPPGDAEQLAEQMLRLDRDRSLCREMGQRGRQNIEQICATHYDRLLGFYDEARHTGRREPGPCDLCATSL